MNVALSALPRFSARCPEQALTGGIIMAPTLDYMDRAWQDAKARGSSRELVVEMLIPSTIDPTLAPRGAHVASLFCQHFDPPWAAPGTFTKTPRWPTCSTYVSDLHPAFAS